MMKLKDIEFKWIESTQKVLSNKEPTSEEIEIYTMLRGDRLSFQLAYFFQGENKERAKVILNHQEDLSVSIRQVVLVPCAYPTHQEYDEDYMVYEPGVYPDLLRDLTNDYFPLVVGQWRSLWIEVEAKQTCKVGIHKLCFQIEFEGENIYLNRQIEVLAPILDELPIIHTEWFHTDCIANYYQEEIFSHRHWELIGHFMKVAARRNCNMILTPIFTPPLDTAEGCERKTVQLVNVKYNQGQYEFDFTLFERWVYMAQQAGIKFFEISHLFTQWGAKSAPKIMVWEDGKLTRKFFWDTPAESLSYQEFLQAFLPKLIQKIKDLGIEKYCYFHISDEPNLDNFDHYRKAKEIIAPFLKDFPIMDALSNYEFYQKGIVDIAVCANDHIEPFLEHHADRLWTYYCTGQKLDVSNRFIAQDGYRTRMIGVQLYLSGLDGFLHWGYNFYHSDFSREVINPYLTTDADGAFPSGDPFLVYPGSDGYPEESIRFILLDDAMNDLKALYLLEKLSSREEVINLIHQGLNEKITFKNYPRTHGFLPNLRQRVHEKIRLLIC